MSEHEVLNGVLLDKVVSDHRCQSGSGQVSLSYGQMGVF